MLALEQNGTWNLAALPPGKKAVRCRWVYTVKLKPDELLAHLKACLIAKRYFQVYGMDS